LVLAIYQVEGIIDMQIENIKEEIDQLTHIRDYWAAQGIPDEIVFDLTLLSRQMGIEGCEAFIKENESYHLDAYVEKVAQYKYNLEQNLELLPIEIADEGTLAP
jgi:hypothetical protein